MEIFMSIWTILMSLVVWYIKKNYELQVNRDLEKFKTENQSSLQREAYFRQLSGNDLQKTFSGWAEILIDVSKLENSNKRELLDLQRNVILFGSDESIRICSKLMQYLYKNGNNNDENDHLVGIIYIAHLISSLKYDFTGYIIQPLDLLKMRVNDLDIDKVIRLDNIVRKNLEFDINRQ